MIPSATKSSVTSLEASPMTAGAQIRTLILSVFLACLVSVVGFFFIALLVIVRFRTTNGSAIHNNPEGAAGVLSWAVLIAAIIAVVAVIPLSLLFFIRLCKRHRSIVKSN
jgi:heme/copper-type cytochrome/quinol oxidase subunit 2